MPSRLSNAIIKALALTGNPANARRFHLLKNTDKDASMAKANSTAADGPDAQELPADIIKSIQAVALTKSGADADAREAFDAAGVLAHQAKDSVSLEDWIAMGKAVGLSEVVKAAKDDEEAADEDDAEDEGDAEESGKDDKKGKKAMPWDTKKSAKGAAVSKVDLEKSDAIAIKKAYDAIAKQNAELLADVAKSRQELAVERDIRVTKSIREEVGKSFKHLAVDHDELAGIVKSMREGGNAKQHDSLMGMFRALDAQAAFAARNGGLTGSIGKSTQMGAGGSAMDRIRAHVQGLVAKSAGKNESQVMSEFLLTPEGRELANEHYEESK